MAFVHCYIDLQMRKLPGQEEAAVVSCGYQL